MRPISDSWTSWRSVVGDAPAPVRRRLDSRWSDRDPSACASSPLGQLRYRSNLLGADLASPISAAATRARSSHTDPLTGEPCAPRGQGQRRRPGLDRRRRLRAASARCARGAGGPLSRRGARRRDGRAVSVVRVRREQRAGVDRYAAARVSAVRARRSPPSGLGDRARGQRQRPAALDEFNQRYGRHLVWMAWQRPGFELAMQIRRAIEASRRATAFFSQHGLFTWGGTSASCYEASIATIDQLGAFVESHANRIGNRAFGGRRIDPPADRRNTCGGDSAACQGSALGGTARLRSLGPLRRCGGVCVVALGAGSMCAGHQLPRSFSSHAHLPPVRAGGGR